MRFDPDRHHRRSIRLKGYDYSQAGAYFITICTQNRECLFGQIVVVVGAGPLCLPSCWRWTIMEYGATTGGCAPTDAPNGESQSRDMGQPRGVAPTDDCACLDKCMMLNDVGEMVRSTWMEMPEHYPGVLTDAFVVMPNHVHGIVILMDRQPRDMGGQARGPAPTVALPDDACACPHVGDGQPQDTGQPRGPAPTLSLPDVVHRFKSLTTARYRHGVSQNGWQPFHGRLWQRNYYEHVIRDEAALNRIRWYIHANPLRWDRDEENLDPIGGSALPDPDWGWRRD